MNEYRIARILFVAAMLHVPAAFAQINTGDITGVVRDAAGGLIANATVTALDEATHIPFVSKTNDSGEFLLAQLPPSQYVLTAEAPEFKLTQQPAMVIHAGDRLRQDFVLTIGQRSEIVFVMEGASPLQTESGVIKDVIENQQVLDIPLKGREFLELTLMGAGVVNPPGGTRGDSLQQTGKLINILGQRTGHNLFLVDGVSVTDQYYNNVVLSPPLDDIREFSIAKANYDAEFGGKSGGVVNVVTQSGTDRFRGALYEYLRNDIFDARNFFSLPGQPAPPFRENQFGAVFGGPIVRNKTFFFVGYDGLRTVNSLTHLFSVPTANQKAGIFGTTPIVNPATGLPFPGNTINVPLDPAAVALLSKIPAPNQPGASNNLLAMGAQTNHNNQYMTRLDHRISAADNLYIRGSIWDANEYDPFGSSVLNEALLPGFGRILKTHSDSVSVGETHVFSPNLLNELRFGWLYASGGQKDPNAGNTFASQYGLLGATSNPADQGYPQVSLSNAFSTIGDAAGFTTRSDRNFEFYDNLTLQRGSHTIKFGGYFFHLYFNPSFPNAARGLYTYNGAYTGNPLGDLLLGYPSQAQVGLGEGAENAQTSWAHFYIQDGWRITPALRIEAGLRYEYNQNLTARSNQTSDINLTAPGGPAFVVSGNPAALSPAAAAVAALSPIPAISAGSIGWNDSLLKPKNLRLSPRLGVAWQAMPHTVLRAGFGIYTNQAAYSILQNLAENVPFFLVKTVVNSSGHPTYRTQDILNGSFNSNGTVGATGVNHDFAIEYNEVWNVALQRQLPGNISAEAEYIGSRTVHADSSTVLNVPTVFGGVRPYPNLSAFTTIRWDGWATFHGLTLKASRRFAQGLSFETSYTWSKSIDDGSDTGTTNAEYNLPQNPYAPAVEKALSSFDHRNRFTANLVYRLPGIGKSTPWLARLTNEWRLSGLLVSQSGAPFTVNLSSAAGQDVAHIGLLNGNNLERPNLVADPNAGPQVPTQWFNTAAFVLPSQNSFGNAGRNVVFGPALTNLDVSLQKEIPIKEICKLLFRVDFYNALNHPNFDLPGRIFGASNFGVISSAQDPRELQFGLKLSF